MKHLLTALAFSFIGATAIAQPPIGSKAPEISLPNAKGETVTLSGLRGKVVLLDFWASWCGPCRASNRKIGPLYKKYKSQGLEILGVSIDDNHRAWTNAVKKDRITWVQVIDTKAATGNQLASTWNLRYIPSTFLIDKLGKIVAVDPQKEELEKWLKQLL